MYQVIGQMDHFAMLSTVAVYVIAYDTSMWSMMTMIKQQQNSDNHKNGPCDLLTKVTEYAQFVTTK